MKCAGDLLQILLASSNELAVPGSTAQTDGSTTASRWSIRGGFDVAKIDMPVSVWYGSDDVLSPRGHAEWLIANIREAERRMIPGGHMLADDAFAETLRWATA